MPYPKEFYYTDRQNSIIYRRQPTASLKFDTNRMLRGLPCWIDDSSDSKEKNKKLIIADWTCFSWSKYKIERIIKELTALMSEGFKIYVWQDGEIIYLEPENMANIFKDEELRNKMFPHDLSSIIQVAGTVNKIKVDELLILDDYWIYYLLHQNKGLQKRCLSVYKVHLLINSDLNIPITFFTKFISQSQPALDAIIMDYSGIDAKKTLTKLCEQFRTARTIEISRSASYSIHQLKDSLKELPKMEDLKYLSVTLNRHTDHSSVGLNEPELQKVTEVLSPLVRLKKISIYGGQINIPKETPDFLSELHELELRATIITTDNARALAKILPHLKKISLPPKISLDNIKLLLKGKEGIEIRNLIFSPTWLINLSEYLEYLKQFSVTSIVFYEFIDSSINVKQISSILHAFSQTIEEINFGHCEIIDEPCSSTLFPYSLPFLKKLSLHDSNINDSLLSALLHASPVLKKLDLSDTNNLTNPSFPNLSRLKKVCLTNSTIEISIILQNLIQSAPALEDLSFTPTIKDLKSLKPNDKSRLKELTFYKKFYDTNQTPCAIDIEDINAICEAFPAIETLNFRNFSALALTDLPSDELKALIRRPLKHLKEIDYISDYNCGALCKTNMLIIISSLAPNLEELYLDSSYIISSKLPENLFPSLIKLEVGEDDIRHCSVNEIEAYFRAAPNLELCDFTDFETIYGAISKLTAGCLPNLTSCQMGEAKISRANLEILFQAAPLLNRKEHELYFTISDIDILKKPKEHRDAEMFKDDDEAEMDDDNEFNSSFSEKKDMVVTEEEEDDDDEEDTYNSSQSNTQNTAIIDADTESRTTRYDLTSIFSPLNQQEEIHPRDYRLNVFQSTATNPEPCTIKKAFFQKKEGDLQLFPMTFSREPANYEGVQELILRSDAWMALASLSPMEQMVDFKASKDVEMQYSLRDNLYYIRHKPKPDMSYDMLVKVNIQFRLYVPAQCPYPEVINTYIKPFLEFTEGELIFDDEDAILKGEDYLDAILTQRKGACRHRAFAFAHYYKDEFKIRIVNNECHAFVEVQSNGNWIQCDLGGYPTEVHIKKPSAPIAQENKSSNSQLFKQFFSALQRSEKPASISLTTDDYFRECLQVSEKKWLIECIDANQVDAIHYGLWSYCLRKGHPVFYINSPDDLQCSADYMIKGADGRGLMQKGPGGPLYNFLTFEREKEQPKPVLMVNYANFENQDLACFNSLLDTKRQADGTILPDDLMIIGLIDNNNPDKVPGLDFYSRFGKNRGLCPISSEELASFIPGLPTTPQSLTKTPPPYVINLYHAPDWEQRLLGQWCPTQDGELIYREGELQKALKESKIIEIQNGLWQNKEFCRFWQEALLLGSIRRDQCDIELPTGLTINQREGYDWSSLTDDYSLQTSLDKRSKIINPNTVSDFFTHNEIKGSQLTEVPGFIEQTAQKERIKTLKIYLTRSVSDDIWAMLLAESQKHGVTLRIFFAKDTTFPQFFGNDPLHQIHEELSVIEETQLIYSTESDTTLFKIKQKYPKAITIDISECSVSDLLFKVERQEGASFAFRKTTCALINLLKEGKTVILKGRFSDDLRNGLDPFLFERLKQEKVKGRLIMLSEDESIFPYLAEQRHIVSIEDKRKALGYIPESLLPYLATEPLAKLKTRRDFIATHPGLSSDATFDGLTSLSASQKDPGENLDLAHAGIFQQSRIEQVQAILSHSPYVFLTGLSGVGKTTFVTKILHQEGKSKLYYGESGLLAWALDENPDLIKYLFWDEDNLSLSDRTQFEGLYDNEHHGIIIQGQYYLLSNKHKMIFAGNPLNIGGERKLASFFARHGQALVFEPIPSSVLYHDLLLPLFKGTRLTKNTQLIICTALLNYYRFLCQNSHAELLISPRELQMMALLTIAHCQKLKIDNNVDEVVTAYYFGYQISQTLVPSALLPTFQEQFYKSTLPRPAKLELQDFYVTSSRIDPLNILHTFLSLRESRQNKTHFRHESQRSGGLGGVILESAPGQGKSEMVIALLRTRGYTTDDLQKRYYHLPASMSSTKKEELLLIAFNQGAVVVIDEINCFPINEKLLNALLMGTTPEGQKAAYPGFMIIGTQNPITLAGRNNFSTAIYRRLLKIELPNYSRDEMLEIIAHQGILPENASDLVSAHESIQESKPAFREVLSIAKIYQKLLDSAIKTAKIGDVTAIDRLIHSKQYLRIDLIHYYLNELDLNEATNQEYEILVYLFVSSKSMEELQDLFNNIKTDEDFIESLNYIIRKHQETKYNELNNEKVFIENPDLERKYKEKLETNVSATLIDPWFCNSTIKIKELMDETNMSFKQAWLYTNHYDDIIIRMLSSYLHYPTVALMLAPLLGCSHDDAKKICQVAKNKARFPATHMFLNQTPKFFESHQRFIRQRQEAQRERRYRDEEKAKDFNHGSI